MNNKYDYLFPFEKIPAGKKILIYGAGDLGYDYYQQILISSYCKVVAFIDREPTKRNIPGIQIYSAEKIPDLEYDYIIVALKAGANMSAVVKALTDMGVNENRVVWSGIRDPISMDGFVDDNVEPEDALFAYSNPELVSVAMKFGPGIGDLIIRKKFVNAVGEISDKIQIDIYAPLSREVFEAFYADCDFVNSYIQDGGSKYAANCNKYDIALQPSYIVGIDGIELDRIANKSERVADVFRKAQKSIYEYGLRPNPEYQKRIHYERSKFTGYNCITAFNYTGICNISDMIVEIPLNTRFLKDFNKLDLGKYITINYGNDFIRGNDGTNRIVSKQWPFIYFEKLTGLIKEQYPGLNIVQLGIKGVDKIKGADYYILGEHIEIVKYVLKNSILHIDIEGGLVHIATQLGTKCVVLFGPTPVFYFGYPENINIVSEACDYCLSLYDDQYRCAKGYDRPECMFSITPEYVMEHIKQYMSSIGIQASEAKDGEWNK